MAAATIARPPGEEDHRGPRRSGEIQDRFRRRRCRPVRFRLGLARGQERQARNHRKPPTAKIRWCRAPHRSSASMSGSIPTTSTIATAVRTISRRCRSSGELGICRRAVLEGLMLRTERHPRPDVSGLGLQIGPDVSGLGCSNRTRLGIAKLLCIHVFLRRGCQDVDAWHKACARASWTRVPDMNSDAAFGLVVRGRNAELSSGVHRRRSRFIATPHHQRRLHALSRNLRFLTPPSSSTSPDRW